MLKFIDISSHQGDIDLSCLPIDAVVVKATEGLTYVNPYCDPKIQQAKSLDLPYGFYHYARNNDATEEADWFINNCLGYVNDGIPILDWEENQSVDWVNEFVARVRERTGVNPWIYANPWRFNQGGVDGECDRWIAKYPLVKHPDLDYDPGDIPDVDGLVCAWQYASDGRIDGYDDNLDLNHFYGSVSAWNAYAGKCNHIEPAYTMGVTESDEMLGTEVIENDNYKITIERKN